MTDGDLRDLQAAGYVKSYNTEWVELPGSLDVAENTSSRVQAYYIATTLPVSQFDNVRAMLPQIPLKDVVQAVRYDDVIAICKSGGEPFPTLHDAEEVRQQLVRAVPDVFGQAFVSVYEVSLRHNTPPDDAERETPKETMHTAVEPKTTTTEQTVVFVEGTSAEVGQSLRAALSEQAGMTVLGCVEGKQALLLIEDTSPAVVIVNLQLPDMHGWAFIQKLRENPAVSETPLIVISEDADDMVMALKVVRARAFFSHPVDVAKLRLKLRDILEGRDGWL